jgi:hypothetical protein
MPTIDTEENVVPDILAARIPEKLKADIGLLMRLERRKISNIAMILIEEAIPVKKKIHDHKNQLMPVRSEHGESIFIQRVALDGNDGDYKMKPGLGISFIDKDGNGPVGFMIDKSEALALAANLSIFLNEVNL